MSVEIERKFLVQGDGWRDQATSSVEILQGYFDVRGGPAVRVRVAGERANLNIKGRARGASRQEFEYPIPVEDARAMLQELCPGRQVAKTRYFVPAAEPGLRWEIDVYHGALEGHATAELEIPREDYPFQRPEWLGEDKTYDHRFSNAALAAAGKWPEE